MMMISSSQLVSCLMPAYNSEATVLETVASLPARRGPGGRKSIGKFLGAGGLVKAGILSLSPYRLFPQKVGPEVFMTLCRIRD